MCSANICALQSCKLVLLLTLSASIICWLSQLLRQRLLILWTTLIICRVATVDASDCFACCSCQLPVASWQWRQLAAACGMWHLLLHFWPEGKQKYACKVGTESGAPIQSGFYLLPFVCAFFDNLPPFLLPNKHLFVCFSISQRALFIRQHTDKHTHTMPEIQQKKQEKGIG